METEVKKIDISPIIYVIVMVVTFYLAL